MFTNGGNILKGNIPGKDDVLYDYKMLSGTETMKIETGKSVPVGTSVFIRSSEKWIICCGVIECLENSGKRNTYIMKIHETNIFYNLEKLFGNGMMQYGNSGIRHSVFGEFVVTAQNIK